MTTEDRGFLLVGTSANCCGVVVRHSGGASSGEACGCFGRDGELNRTAIHAGHVAVAESAIQAREPTMMRGVENAIRSSAFWGRHAERHVEKSTSADVDSVKSYDFAAAIRALRSNDPLLSYSTQSNSDPGTHPDPYDNTLLILGAESSTFYQRVPVPIGMWQPFGKSGVPLHLNAPGVIILDGQRVAVLICYEQLLVYPILSSMLQRPAILVGISNMYWFANTPIPRYQGSALRAWAKLFRVPYLLAVNS